MSGNIDIGVAVRQGIYFRPDAQTYLNDYDYQDWLIRHKAEGYQIIKNGQTATLTKARKEHHCSECPEMIARGEHYWSITYNGSGLGSIKFPDRVHRLVCLDRYWAKQDKQNGKQER